MGLYLNDYDFLVLPLQKLSKMKKYLKKQKKICSSWTISLRKSILIHQLRFFHFSFSRFNTDTDANSTYHFPAKKNTCSTSVIQILEKAVHMFKINNKDTKTTSIKYLIPFSSVDN